MTIQEALRKCDKKEIADLYICKYGITRSLLIGEHDDLTIGDIRRIIREHVYHLIDKLCKMKPGKKEEDMLLMVTHYIEEDDDDIAVTLFNKNEIKEKKEYYTSYGYDFTPFEDTLDFEVADTYLTKYYLNDLITEYLYEITWTGWDQEGLESNIKKLKEADEDFKKHQDDPKYYKSFDEVKKEMEEEYGFELEKEDPDQQKAYREYARHQMEYCDKCIEIELKKWRKANLAKKKSKAK